MTSCHSVLSSIYDFITYQHYRKKLNLDGKALQALAKKALISGDDEADDKALEELNIELVNKKVDSRLFLRFVSALRQL